MTETGDGTSETTDVPGTEPGTESAADEVTEDPHASDFNYGKVKYEKITPFIMPDGNPGVLGCICYGEDSQFSGLESMRCFNMKTMERASFS